MEFKGTYDGPCGTSQHPGAMTVGLAIEMAAQCSLCCCSFFHAMNVYIGKLK